MFKHNDGFLPPYIRSMRRDLARRLLTSAKVLADAKFNVDSFVEDTVDAHLGLLEASENLEKVVALLQRSDSQGPAEKLTRVKQRVDEALDVLRRLDSLYHSGKISFGNRTPQVVQRKNTHSLQSSQERPTKDRPTRKLFSQK